MKKLLSLVATVGLVGALGFGITQAAVLDQAQASGSINVGYEPNNNLKLKLESQTDWVKNLSLPQLLFTNETEGTVVLDLKNEAIASGSGCTEPDCGTDVQYNYAATFVPYSGQTQADVDFIASNVSVKLYEDVNNDGVFADDGTELLFNGTLFTLANGDPQGSGRAVIIANPDMPMKVKVVMKSMADENNVVLGALQYNLKLTEIAAQ